MRERTIYNWLDPSRNDRSKMRLSTINGSQGRIFRQLGNVLYYTGEKGEVIMVPEIVGRDDTFGLMDDSRRRFALYYFLSNDYTDIDTLALQVAAWEQGEPIDEVSESDVESVKISLHHIHLPKLEEKFIIEYDGRSGDIVVDDGFDEIQPVLAKYKTDDEESVTSTCV